jgi:glycosyltransferase involved in cell wall biosynthesis
VRILLVSGIFPPDIGGPATHVVDLRDEFLRRDHAVTVLTLWDGAAVDAGPELIRFPRAWPWPARMAAVTSWLVRNASRYDVVYATGLQPAAVAGAKVSGRPVVVKIVGDFAWERGRRLGLTAADFDAFQVGRDRRDVRVRAMRWVQNATLRSADEISAPSETLRATIEGWLGGPAPVEVIPNGVRPPPRGTRRSAAAPFVYVGRLVAHKRVDRIVEAVAMVKGARLEVIGEGPEADRLVDLVGALEVEDRVALRGAMGHDDVIGALSRAAALVLASDYEGLPHVVLEALACGTPVVSPPVGGLPEVVTEGKNGLLLSDASVRSLAAGIRRIREDRGLATKLRAGAREAGKAWRIERTADGVEALLHRAIAGRPKAVFVGKTRVAPPPADLGAKLRAMTRHVRTSLVGIGRPGVRSVGVARTYALPVVRPKALESALFYALAPPLAVGLATGRGRAGERRRTAVVCQSPYEAVGAVALARALPRGLRPRVVVELHGDWRSASRLYGGAGRERFAALADDLATSALRRADRVRVIGSFTEELARRTGFDGPIDRFPTFSEYDLFLDEPPTGPPETDSVLFVGALERVKGVDVLLDAWQLVRDRRPGARLVIVGKGSMEAEVRRRAARDPDIEMVGPVPREALRDLLDAATLVVLPSRSEGLGRVVLEASARSRPVVASRVGGIPELVEDGETGVLVRPEDATALAAAVLRILDDPATAKAMGERGRRRALSLDPAGAFDAGIERLARWIAEP